MPKKKSLRTVALASGRKMNRDIYFNKKRRRVFKKSFLETQKEILENEDFSVKPVLKEEYDKRMLTTSMLAFTVSWLETIEKAEKYDKKVYLTDSKFILYRKEMSVVFKATFLKPLLDNKVKTSFLCFPQGFPRKTKKKTFIYKDGRKFSLKGYEEIDSGTFKQKVLDYKDISLKYKGKKDHYNFKLTLINDEKQSYWVTSL